MPHRHRFEQELLTLNTQLQGLEVQLETDFGQGLYLLVSRKTETEIRAQLPLYRGGGVNWSATKVLPKCEARLRYKSLLRPESFAGKKPPFDERLSRPLLALVRHVSQESVPSKADLPLKHPASSTQKEKPKSPNNLDSLYRNLQGLPHGSAKQTPDCFKSVTVRNPFFERENLFELSEAASLFQSEVSFVSYKLLPWIESPNADSLIELTQAEALLLSESLDIRIY